MLIIMSKTTSKKITYRKRNDKGIKTVHYKMSI